MEKVSKPFSTEIYDFLENFYESSHFRRMVATLCNPPSVTSMRVSSEEERPMVIKQLNDILNNTINSNHHDDNRSRNSSGMQQFLVAPHAILPDVIVIPCVGPYAVNLDADVGKNSTNMMIVIVDKMCGEAVLRGANVFAVGIKSTPARLQKNDRICVYADVENQVLKGSKDAVLPKNAIFVGIGISKVNRYDVVHDAEEVGLAIEMTERIFETPALNGVLVDKIFLQNIPSIVVAHALHPQLGELVLDMCAAPGGKTLHLAHLMKNKGRVVACDKNMKKCKNIVTNAKRFSLTCIKTLCLNSIAAPVTDISKAYDGISYDSNNNSNNNNNLNVNDNAIVEDVVKPSGGLLINSFDKILLDPPCSALGNRPILLHDEMNNLKSLKATSELQRAFIVSAVKLLKPGGTMTYSTCTINPLENEAMVRFALDNLPLKLIPATSSSMSLKMIGQPGLISQSFLTEEESVKVQRFDPAINNEVTGFFLAKVIH